MTSTLAIKRILLIITSLAFVCALASCSGVRTGLSGEDMLISGNPKLDIAPAGGLEMKLSGVRHGSLQTDSNLGAYSQIHYSVYGKEQDKKVLAHGHVMSVAISSRESWEFSMESLTQKNEVYLREVDKGYLSWTEHLMYVKSEGDWFSDLWRENGREIPETWLGKRWSRTFFGDTRVIVEYREPMPECVDVSDTSGQSYFIHAVLTPSGPECKRQLDDFNARAEAAFVFQKLDTDKPVEAPAPSVLTVLPQTSFDMTRLVGKAQVRDIGGKGVMFGDD